MDPSEQVSSGRGDALLTLALSAAAAALVTAISSVSPTGSAGTDAVVTFLLAWLVIWCGSSAPWWALLGTSAVALIGVGLSGWLVAAVVAAAAGLAARRGGRAQRALGVASVAAAILDLFHVAIDPFLGCSALVAGAGMAFVAVAGLVRRDPSVRRGVLWSLAGTGVLAFLALVGLGVAVLEARTTLQRGSDRLQDGFDQLRAGDTAAAAQTLRLAAADLEAARSDVDGFWAQPARLLPVVAQHRDLAVHIVTTGESSATAASDALALVDLDRLRLVGGSLDVATLGSLAEPLARLDAAVRDLADTLSAGSESPWLVGAVRDQLATGRDQIGGALVQTAASSAVAAEGPAVLGADGTRRYLVVFTVPGSARALSGTITDYAEIEVTDGHIEQSGFGPIDDLTIGADPTFWSTVTTELDLPTAARAMATAYAAAGRPSVDGVIMMDAFGIAALVEASGPITLDPTTISELPTGITVPNPITADALRRFLLVDQYSVPAEQRATIVQAAAGTALREFLGADLPDVQQLADALGPAATEGHISWWASRPDEEEAFRLIGMAARLPLPDGRDGLAVVSNNTGGTADFSDAFIQRTIAETLAYDAATGHVVGDVTVTLQNLAPSGTNHTSLLIYSAATDGTWSISTHEVVVPAGESRSVTVHVDTKITPGAYALLVRPQTMTLPDVLHLDVRDVNGAQIVALDGTLARTSVVDSEGITAAR